MKGSICLILGVFVLTFLSSDGIASEADPVNAGDRAYFIAIQNAVQKNDKNWLADQIIFPLDVYPTPGKAGVKTRKEFLDRYDEIINDYIRQEVKNQQAGNLAKNWSGLAIGDGAIWVAQLGPENSNDGPWKYYITTINNKPPDDPGYRRQ